MPITLELFRKAREGGRAYLDRRLTKTDCFLFLNIDKLLLARWDKNSLAPVVRNKHPCEAIFFASFQFPKLDAL